MRYKKLSMGLAAGAVALGGAFFAVRPAVAQAFSNTAISSLVPAQFGGGMWGLFGLMDHGIGRDSTRLLIDATASVTGLTNQEVMTQLQAGQSLTQIAESKGKTADDVIASARSTLQTNLKQAVTDGKLTQAQSDAQLQSFDANAKTIMSQTGLNAGPFGGQGHGGFGPGFGHGGFGRGGSDLVSATASVTGLTNQEVMTQLQSGKSLAQIAESKGKTGDDVIAAARTALETNLKQAVTDGKLTQAQADAALKNFDANAKTEVNQTGTAAPFGGGFGHGGVGRGDGGLVAATASVTGLTNQEVMTQLQSGKSLAQIAESKGKTADDVIAAARTTLETSLKQAVTDGKLTQAQADADLKNFDANAKTEVNETGMAGPMGDFGHGGFGRGQGGLVAATASVTGLTNQEVVTQLQSGKSLAQIAESKGKTGDDVIAAARTTLQTSLKQAVTDGKLTQAQADAELANFAANAKTEVNQTGTAAPFGGGFGHGGFDHGGFGHGGGELVSATASVTGLTTQEVMTQMQAGKSLAQIAESKGKTADEVIASARGTLEASLKQAVTDGKLTQAQADAELQRFDSTAKQVMTATFQGGPWGAPNSNNPGATFPSVTPDTNGNSA